jgi:hypothetical protein
MLADFALTETQALFDENRKLIQALERIRDMDYRGNRHSSADIAQKAIADARGLVEKDAA